jgi:hypothetical protein
MNVTLGGITLVNEELMRKMRTITVLHYINLIVVILEPENALEPIYSTSRVYILRAIYK